MAWVLMLSSQLALNLFLVSVDSNRLLTIWQQEALALLLAVEHLYPAVEVEVGI